MSGIHVRTQPQRTDSRPLAERKHSVTLRIAELRAALRAAEETSAELDIQIEAASRAREASS